jgi:hypothetical protein
VRRYAVYGKYFDIGAGGSFFDPSRWRYRQKQATSLYKHGHFPAGVGRHGNGFVGLDPLDETCRKRAIG